jgi:hypothetical protein
MKVIERLQLDVLKDLETVTYVDSPEENIRLIEDIRNKIADMTDVNIPDSTHIAEVGTAVNQNIQLRDFFMGLRIEAPVENIIAYLIVVSKALKKELATPFVTVLASYFYEIEDTENAKALLSEALEFDPNYSLAKLLDQAFDNGYPADFLVDMSKECHSQVLEKLTTEGNL